MKVKAYLDVNIVKIIVSFLTNLKILLKFFKKIKNTNTTETILASA